MKRLLCCSAVLILLVALVILLPEADSKGRSKSSWFGSKKKTSSGGGLFGGSSRRKSKYGTLKKAAVIGASVYGGYQLGKLTSRFGHYGGGYRYGFNDWNRWREVDGFMCRDNNDCNWIDDRLYCQDYELDFEPSALWFGGDYLRIIGECSCPVGFQWDNYELECERGILPMLSIMAYALMAILVVAFCCGCFVLAMNKSRG